MDLATVIKEMREWDGVSNVPIDEVRSWRKALEGILLEEALRSENKEETADGTS